MNQALPILRPCPGRLMAGFAIAEAFLPALPTTPFLLLAAGLFAWASPRLERWLLEPRTFGRFFRLWREKEAMSARAKAVAIALIAASLIFFYILSKPSPT